MFGILSLVTGNLVGGLWLALIGMFLKNAARGTFEQLLLRQTLEGEPVSRFMVRNPITVPPDLTVDRLVDDYVYNFHHKAFPVSDNSHVLGSVGVSEIKLLEKADWHHRTVREITTACSEGNTTGPDADAAKVLARIARVQSNAAVSGSNFRMTARFIRFSR